MIFRRPLHQLGLHLRRCLIAEVALLGYLLATIGFPLPRLATDSQAANPPAPVSLSCGCPVPEGPGQGCCCSGKKGRKSCCSPEMPLAGAKLNREEKTTLADPSDQAASSLTLVWVVGMSARHCHGQGSFWTDAPPALPPPPWISWSYLWIPDSWLTPPAHQMVGLSAQPLTPPPRAA